MKTFNLTLTHDEIIALARAIDAWAESQSSVTFNGESLTVLGNLLSITQKLPDESILDAMEEPKGILSEQDVQELEKLAGEMVGIVVEMQARGLRVDVETVVGKETE